MRRLRLVLSSLTLLSTTKAFDMNIAAIVPTSHGQIGINPIVPPVTLVVTGPATVGFVPKATGNPKANIGSIGTNTDFLTADGSSTRWIAANTYYLTELIETATVDGIPIESTQVPSAQIIGQTDDDGLPTGPFDLLVTPMIVSQIQALADTHCKDKATCLTEFPPRVDLLLRNSGTVLTKRHPVLVAGAILIFFAIAVESTYFARPDLFPAIGSIYYNFADGAEPIPHIIHVDYSQGSAAPSPSESSSPNLELGVVVMHPTTAQTEEENGDKCWKYVGVDVEQPPDPYEALMTSIDEGIVAVSRSIAGRISINNTRSLLQRQKPKQKPKPNTGAPKSVKYINKIGNCDTAPTKDSIVRAEIHPRPGMVMAPFDMNAEGENHGLDPNLYWYVPSQEPEEQGQPCVIAKLTKKGKRDPASMSIGTDNFPSPYDQSGDRSKTLNVDHIFETSLLNDFFESLFQPNDDKCKTFVPLFNLPDTGLQQGLKTRFYSLWREQSNPIPGNWAFAGTDLRINELKGKLLKPGIVGFPTLEPKAPQGIKDVWDVLFQTWNNVGLSMDFINDPYVASYFAQRNGMIYAAFRDFDKIQGRCVRDKKDPTFGFSWAQEYKKFITNLLATNELLIQAKVTQIIAKIEEQSARLKTKNGVPNEYGKAFVFLKSIYAPSLFRFPPALLNFPDANRGILRRGTRDVEADDMCLKPKAVEPQPTPTPVPAPPQPPVLGPQGCFATESHVATHEGSLNEFAKFCCNNIFDKGGKETMDANSVAITCNPSVWTTITNSQNFGIGWIKGCQTTATTQSISNPLADGKKEHTCAKIFWTNWRKCYGNAGTGGWIDVGCLRYTFKNSPAGLVKSDNWADVVKTS